VTREHGLVTSQVLPWCSTFLRLCPTRSRHYLSQRAGATLMEVLLEYCEERVTMHAERIIPGLCRTVSDEEADIADRGVRACKLFGKWVPVETWLAILSTHIRTSAASPIQTRSSYIVLLGSLAEGAGAEAVAPHLGPLTALLAEEDVLLTPDPRWNPPPHPSCRPHVY
jgi:hypothetical protein